jgi:hypothetical protein
LVVSESQRLALHKAARAVLGEEEGDTLMELSPSTEMATRQDVERSGERLEARLAVTTADLRAHTWKVVVGTGVALYLAMVATMSAGAALLLQVLDFV